VLVVIPVCGALTAVRTVVHVGDDNEMS
jgi:hypothetical protein